MNSPYSFPYPIEAFSGKRWRCVGLKAGHHGGFLILLEYAPTSKDLPWSKEMDYPVAIRSLGPKVSGFFGFSIEDEVMIVPSIDEINGRFDYFNSLLEGGESDPAYLHYRYDAETSKNTNYLRAYIKNKTLPASQIGHLYIHDINAHNGFNWVPLKYNDLVEAQYDFLTLFLGYLNSNYPQLAKHQVTLRTFSLDGGEMNDFQMDLSLAMLRKMATQVDFGLANYGINLDYETLSTPFHYTEIFGERTPICLPKDHKEIFREDILSALVSIKEFTGNFLSPKNRCKDLVSEWVRQDQSLTHVLDLVDCFEVPDEEKKRIEMIEKEYHEAPPDPVIWKEVKQRYLYIAKVIKEDRIPKAL